MRSQCGKICLHEVKACSARLRSRGAISVKGKDAEKFLQNLVSADVRSLEVGSGGTLAGFLNSRGRCLYDVIVSRPKEDEYYVDACASKVRDLIGHLKKFKLRADVEIFDLYKKMTVWSFMGYTDPEYVLSLSDQTEGAIAFLDPRCRNLGLRVLLPERAKVSAAPELVKGTEKAYKLARILNGIGESALSSGGDFEDEELPLECNFDRLGGVSFNKGCYVGQELTARTHHTGVVRKRFLPVSLSESSEESFSKAWTAENFVYEQGGNIFPQHLINYGMFLDEKISMDMTTEGNERKSGALRSTAYNLGMAHLRLDHAFSESSQANIFKLNNGMYATPWKPRWFVEAEEAENAQQRNIA